MEKYKLEEPSTYRSSYSLRVLNLADSAAFIAFWEKEILHYYPHDR
jgi:hypothetical protein